MEDSLIMEMWDLFIEYIPEKNRELAASQYVEFLLGQGFEIDTLEGFMGYDPHMDSAIKIVVDAEKVDDDYDDGENEAGYDEEEDY